MFYFPFHIWDVILPIDYNIFQDGLNMLKPPTRNGSSVKLVCVCNYIYIISEQYMAL